MHGTARAGRRAAGWPGRRVGSIGRDLSPCLDEHPVRSTGGVFIGDEVLLDVSFTDAQAGLANLIRDGLLASVSNDAYGDGITGLARVGPLGSAPGLSRLVQVHFRDLRATDDSAGLAMRWEAVGPGGGLFPALDADITLAPAGEQATLLKLAAAYRPPLGTVGAELDRAILHRVAAATIRAFLSRLADAIARSGGAAGSAAALADPDHPQPPPEPQTS